MMVLWWYVIYNLRPTFNNYNMYMYLYFLSKNCPVYNTKPQRMHYKNVLGRTVLWKVTNPIMWIAVCVLFISYGFSHLNKCSVLRPLDVSAYNTMYILFMISYIPFLADPYTCFACLSRCWLSWCQSWLKLGQCLLFKILIPIKFFVFLNFQLMNCKK